MHIKTNLSNDPPSVSSATLPILGIDNI